MKNLKAKLSLAAILLSLGTSFATVHRHADSRKWTQDPVSGLYTEVIGEKGTAYDCNFSANTCTETYDSSVDPNDNPSQIAPLSSEPGDFQ